jgi:hypothetical protein
MGSLWTVANRLKLRVPKSCRISERILYLFLGFFTGLLLANSINNQVDLVSNQRDASSMERTPATEHVTLVDLAETYKPSKFTFSHAAYQRFYPIFFEKYRKQRIKMLEIGIDTGAGSLLWKEYFPLADVWGMDINSATSESEGGRAINMVIGSQENRTFLENDLIEKTGGEFDIIIDDGGHHFEQQSLSYEILFSKALKPGGYYVIEDIETSFWQKGVSLYGKNISRGGCVEQDTMFRKMQLLSEVVNKKFIDNNLRVFGDVDHWVKMITFGSNIVLMQKKDHLDCASENLYTWPSNLSPDCKAREQNSDSVYPPENFVLRNFCNFTKSIE